MRRSLALLCLALLVALAAAAPALGARDGQRRERPATGQIEATGTGAVTIRGRVVAFGLIPGRASLVVTDFDGDATVRIDGVLKRIPARTGVLRLRRASGRFYIEGSSLRVRIVGAGLVVSAAGRGRANLVGVGDYRLNDGPERDWPGAREPVPLLPPRSEEGRRRASQRGAEV